MFHKLRIHPFLVLFSDFSVKNYKQMCISGFYCFSFGVGSFSVAFFFHTDQGLDFLLSLPHPLSSTPLPLGFAGYGQREDWFEFESAVT